MAVCVSLHGIRSIGGFDGPFVALYFLQQFIRRGAMTFTTREPGRNSAAATGTGEAGSACDSWTTEAERRVLLNPRTCAGRSVYGGHFRRRKMAQSPDALAILMDQPEILPRWAKLQWVAGVIWPGHAKQFNPRGRSKKQCCASLRSRRAALFPLPRCPISNISCAYFETTGPRPLDDAQLAKKRHLAAKLVGRGATTEWLDIGSGWGRTWPVPSPK